MGCCASTTNKSPPPNSRSGASSHGSRAPPPPFLEEETVKEVLSSETPNPKSRIAEQVQTKIWVNEEDDVVKMPLTTAAHTEDTSDYSEICSLNDAVSTTTFTDDGEVRQRVNRSPAKFRNRSLSGDLSTRREKLVGGKSPARRPDRPDPSPGRVRLVPTRERRGLLPKDAGEKSGRRSRSPAMTRAEPGLGRSPSAKRTGKSPGRVGSELSDKNRTNREEKWPPTGNESLENPLVSLECFIFL